MSTSCMTNSPVAPEALPSSILKTQRIQRKPKTEPMEWNSTGAGFEWISPSQNEPTHPLQGFTWGGPHMVVVAVVEVAVEVHHVVFPGTMTGATTEATIGTIIDMMTATIIDHTDADLHLHTTAEGTAPDPGHGPIHHVTTEPGRRLLMVDSLLIFGIVSCSEQVMYIDSILLYVFFEKFRKATFCLASTCFDM